jgi:hypothetical protein
MVYIPLYNNLITISGGTMQFQQQQLIQSAYKAGIALYGQGLVWRNTSVTFSTITERIRTGIEECTAEEVLLMIDDYEYVFTVEGKGIEASNELITDTRFHSNGYLCTYDPEFGIYVYKVDCTFLKALKIIKEEA